jgi:hypothetical protein
MGLPENVTGYSASGDPSNSGNGFTDQSMGSKTGMTFYL